VDNQVDATVYSGRIIAGGLKFDKSPEQGEKLFFALSGIVEEVY
jgi:hypothetical protein